MLNTSILVGEYDEVYRMPKVLLHTHLEGSIPSRTLRSISVRNGILLPFSSSSETISNLCSSGDWTTFRWVYSTIISCFKTEFDFHDAIFDYAYDLHKEHVIYAELHVSFWKHIVRGVDFKTISKGLISGIKQAEDEFGIHIKIICDIVRHKDEDLNFILNSLNDLPREMFPAIGVSGGPDRLRRELFEGFCLVCKDMGYSIVAHAGELEGAESVHGAITHLKADRISHGLRTLEDAELFQHLLAINKHFELCPTSNCVLGVDKDFSLTRRFINSGVSCSVNTDDELIFNTSLTREFTILLSNNIIDIDDIGNFQRNAMSCAFINETERNIIMKYINSWFADAHSV